ncbi:leukocyte receptor cluster member 1 homolog [Contarinia nasturtii]|uniref:leukocyte receptor cluster member 1 homolog n=1 Tax=Contarinia nasturtii TaxID=265458 RepID=UPI0012D41467|nr:leukocyte receptor cluster member 1 homolog [Contarinia nasturtii]
MNILPHKSWHVRTKENIARVRKDQAKAAEEEAEKQRRIAVADYEARINLLRKRATETSTANESEATANHDGKNEIVSASEHVDLFDDHEEKQQKVKPMDEEKRLEQEKYEKQIGYLTYLGQDTHESLGTQSWYNEAPKRDQQSSYDDSGEKIEVGLRVKHLHDPMFRFLKKPIIVESKSSDKNVPVTQQSVEVEKSTILEKLKSLKKSRSPDEKHKKTKRSKVKKEKKEKKNKHKKEKRRRKDLSSNNSGSGDSDSESEQLRQHKLQMLQKLREERLQREREEQNRTKELLRIKNPTLLPPEELKKPEEKAINVEPRMPPMKQKYNSQFNPYLAKQNYGN